MNELECETAVLEREAPQAERAQKRRELLADFPRIIEIQRAIDARRASRDMRGAMAMFQEIAQNEERWIKFIADEEKKTAAELWRRAEEIGGRDYTDGFRRGIVAQAAVLKALKVAGYEAALASVSWNLAKVDIVLAAEMPVQVKGRWRGPKPVILKCDDISLPVAEIQKSGISHWFNAQDERDMNNFSVKVENFAKVLGRKIVGYLVYIPEKFFDRHTGEPTPDLIKAFQEALAALPEAKELSYTTAHEPGRGTG